MKRFLVSLFLFGACVLLATPASRPAWAAGKLGMGFYNSNPALIDTAVNSRADVILLFDQAIFSAAAIKARAPGTLLVGRIWVDDRIHDGPGGFFEGDAYTNGYNFGIELAEKGHPVDAWQTLNEVSRDKTVQVQLFDLGATHALHSKGYKSVVGNWAVGTPEVDDLLTEEQRQLNEEADYFSYHAYGSPADQFMRINPDWHALRYRKYVDAWRARGWRVPPVILTESGIQGYAGDGSNPPRNDALPGCTPGVPAGWKCYTDAASMSADFAWLEARMNEDSFVVGTTLFLWNDNGSGDWVNFEVKETVIAGGGGGGGPPPPGPSPGPPPPFTLQLQYPDIPGFGKLNDIVKKPLGFSQIVEFLFAATLWLAGLLAFAALLRAGFRLAISAGNPGVRLETKQRLWGIMLGVLILLVSYAVLRTVNPDLVFLRNSNFAVCKDRGGPLDCTNPFFLTITTRPTTPADIAKTLPVHVCLFDKLLKTADGTPALPPSLNPSESRITGCSDKLTNNARYLGDVASSLGGNWDDKAYVAILIGNGRFTFYADPDYSGAWVEITMKGDGTWVCNFQHDGAETYEDCLGKLLDDSRNKENYDKKIPLMLVAFARFQKGTWPTDTFGGTVPGDGGDISSVEIEPRSFGGSCLVPSAGPCSVSALSGVFGEHATEAAQICQKESGGNIASLNDTCKKGGYDYSVGLFQINLYRTCRCPGAWVDPSIPGWCEIEKAMDIKTCPWPPYDEDTLNACAGSYGLGDGTLNAQKALGISSGGTNWCPWSTAKPCGLC